MLDSLALWPFIERGPYTSAQQVGWLTDQARQEARDPAMRLYIPMYVSEDARGELAADFGLQLCCLGKEDVATGRFRIFL